MQDPRNSAIVECDVCGRRIDPHDRCITFQVWCLWSGAMQRGFVCRECAVGRGINAAIFAPPNRHDQPREEN